jgi:hypothetical protein
MKIFLKHKCKQQVSMSVAPLNVATPLNVALAAKCRTNAAKLPNALEA